MMEEKMIREIPKEKFAFVQREDRIHDERMQTKAVGYLGDAWNRFRRNRSAVVAFILIVILLLFALIVPVTSNYTINFRDGYYKTVLPKNPWFANSGFWDGGKREKQNSAGYLYLNAIGQENAKRILCALQRNAFAAVCLHYRRINLHAVRFLNSAGRFDDKSVIWSLQRYGVVFPF